MHACYFPLDVTNINTAIEADPSLEGKSLWNLVKTTSGTNFNNAAQASILIFNSSATGYFDVMISVFGKATFFLYVQVQ